MEKKNITNAMTVDVEDYFHVSAFEAYIAKNQWDNIPHRVEKNTNHILDIFDEHNTKSTFFTLGWVAERYPQLVRRIIKEGHELACHGYEHIRATEQSPEEFRCDIVTTKRLLEDIGGQEVKGYRAASYSICVQNLWAHEVLFEEGFKYSSSVYPVKHDLYGIPGAPRFIYKPLVNKDFIEIPITTLKLANRNIPCGGGGFFRFYPYFFSRQAYNYINKKERQPGIFYFHPWEIDPEQPRQQNLNIKTRFRHYLNLNNMEQRIISLLGDFDWDTMENVFLNKN
jgi:polysaccharide deacetylase family protein (PEP-CTERM system associated)